MVRFGRSERLLACISLVAVTATATSAAPSAPAAKKMHAAVRVISRPAPADEYFGKLKLSILGIRNTIKDVGANLDVDPNRWSGLQNKAIFAEDAMHDWEQKYPTDSWLAKSVFALERMYAKVDSGEGRQRSMAAMTWLVHDFPTTYYGRLGKKEIAEHRVGHPISTAAAPPASATPASNTQAAVPARLATPNP